MKDYLRLGLFIVGFIFLMPGKAQLTQKDNIGYFKVYTENDINPDRVYIYLSSEEVCSNLQFSTSINLGAINDWQKPNLAGSMSSEYGYAIDVKYAKEFGQYIPIDSVKINEDIELIKLRSYADKEYIYEFTKDSIGFKEISEIFDHPVNLKLYSEGEELYNTMLDVPNEFTFFHTEPAMDIEYGKIKTTLETGLKLRWNKSENINKPLVIQISDTEFIKTNYPDLYIIVEDDGEFEIPNEILKMYSGNRKDEERITELNFTIYRGAEKYISTSEGCLHRITFNVETGFSIEMAY